MDDFSTPDVKRFIQKAYNAKINYNTKEVKYYEGIEAVKHIFTVAASLDSLVLGEREILGQIKQALAVCKQEMLCGDKVQLLVDNALAFAKKIHVQTRISEKPISVVSLAYRNLIARIDLTGKNIVFVGAGQTNALFANLIAKHNVAQVTIYNRSVQKADVLCEKFKQANALPLKDIAKLYIQADVVISCTGAYDEIIDKALLQQWPIHKGKTIFIDLAVPNDINKAAVAAIGCPLIEMATLKLDAERNMAARKMEIQKANVFMEEALEDFSKKFKTRTIELALSHIPNRVTAIRERVLQDVFADKIEALDANAKVVLEDIIAYMEEKYIALPYKEAKKSLLHLELNEKF